MRLVLCDDHRLLVTGLALALADLGHLIDAAVTTPEEAVEAIDRHEPDAVLLDLQFPGGTGLDVARWVFSAHPGVHVVVVTGSDDPDHLAAALEIGVRGYVRKAQRAERIAEALERVAAGEVVVDRELLATLRDHRAGGPRVRQDTAPVDTLTPRERHVLGLLVRGAGTPAIAARLGVSTSTVKTHVQSIFVKLHVHSRLQAVATVDRLGIDLGPTDDLLVAE